MRKFLNIAILFLAFSIFAYAFYTRLSNPDMTEMRLLLTYWKNYGILSIGLIVSIFAKIKLGD